MTLTCPNVSVRNGLIQLRRTKKKKPEKQLKSNIIVCIICDFSFFTVILDQILLHAVSVCFLFDGVSSK